MAELRCPMCGKPNPDTLDVCQFCQARLKPLIARPSGGPTPPEKPPAPQPEKPEPASESSDFMDWGTFDTGALGETDETPFDDDTDDWLSRLGDNADPATEQSPAAPVEEEPELPAWMTAGEAAPASAADLESSLPDWLTDSAAAESEFPAEEEPAIPDWLTGGAAETASESEPEGGPADWLTADSETPAEPPPPQETAAPAEKTESSGWLSDFGQQDTIPIEKNADLPDWLTGKDEDTKPAAASTPPFIPDDAGDADAFPDWLSQNTENIPAGTDLSPESAADEELPDWFTSDIETSGEGETPAVSGSTGVTDFLARIESGETAPEISEPAAGAEIPGWLSETDEPAEELPPGSFPADEETGFSDWLGSESEPGTTIEAAAEPPAPETASTGVTDFLRQLDAESSAETAAEQPPAEAGDLPDWLAEEPPSGEAAPAEESEEIPDWLAGLDGFSPPPDEEAAPAGPEIPVDESRAVPEWLREMEGITPEPEGESFEAVPEFEIPEETPFVSDEEFEDDLFEIGQLPDLSEGDLRAADEPISRPVDDALTPAELPGWLAAMRPVESSPAPDGEPGEVETSGPLAGLNNVLSAQPDVIRLKKPPAYSSKLQVSESQQAHAALLQAMLETENKPQPLPLPHLITSHRLFKGALGVLLLIIAFLAVLADTNMAALPATPSQPVMQTRQMVDLLASDDTVLLVFDYEPGFAGEMEAVAAAVVDHIMLRGAKVATVSTSPTGPALAEHFISRVEGEHGYTSGGQYVNLGYIPGGLPGLAAFARTPQWVVPNTLDGVPAWGTGPLQNVSRLSDFALVAVISDSPNTIQAWVEQVQPQLGGTPMVAVVSAQAGPMVRPYYARQSGQLSGLVSGLPDAAAYEVANRHNPARDYWDAFNIVLIVASSAILIGILVITGSDLLTRRKEGGESE